MSANPRLGPLCGRWWITGSALLCAFLALAAPAAADSNAAQTLADRYSPVIGLEPQPKLCGPGEAYRPTSLDIVLGNPEVTLRNSAGEVVKRGPTAQDLSDAPAGDYLDFGGNALRPGCFYEKQFKRWFGDREPTVYVHIATDSEHPGKLAVQYWFYYTFNDFTNKHEGDWEMAQVNFDAATPEEALKTDPYQVDYAQHSGGERGAWNTDPKLTTDGTHPIEYIATGAHAGFFERKLYLGKGGTAVFGCEDTRSATDRFTLHTVVVPDTPVPRDSPFAWLNFQGRWGQRQPSVNNGPLGPANADREVWTHPITWSEGLRTSSLVVPGGRVLGLSVTSFFCGAVEHASAAIIWGLIHPVPLFVLLGLLVTLAVGAASRTRWRPADTQPIRRSRRGGQILGAAVHLYRGNALTFIGIGAVFIPVSLAAAGIQWVLFHLTGLSGVVNLDGRRGAVTALLALLVGDIGGAFAAAAVTGAVSAALSQLEAGQPLTVRRAYALVLRNGRELGGATAVQFVLIMLLVATVVGIPVAVYYFIRTSLFAQVCVLEHRRAFGSLIASARLTRRHWWRTFAFTTLVNTIAILSGPLIGVLILLLTAQSLTFIDITGSLVYTLVVPFAAIALTLYYFELKTRLVPVGTNGEAADSSATLT